MKVNLKRRRRAEPRSRRQTRWPAVATLLLTIAAMLVFDGSVAVLAQDAGAHPPKSTSDSGDDLESAGDSITVTGGVVGVPATPSAETAETAPAEAPPPPRAAAPRAVAAAPAPSPSLSAAPAPAPVPPPRAVAAAPAAAPSFAASTPPPRPVIGRPAIPIAEPTVAEAPAFAPAEPAIPVATAPNPAAPSEEAAGGSGAETAEAPAPAAKPKTQLASAPHPDNGFPGSEFGTNHGPIDIKSDTMSLDYNGRSVLFSGHVRAVQAGGQLTSDKLRVAYGENFHDVKEMFADGNVRISQGNRWETSDHAVLDQTNHTVVLTGSPVVHQGPDQITGKRITVHLDTGQSVVEGARAVIFPKGGETAAGEQAAPSADGAPGEHLP